MKEVILFLEPKGTVFEVVRAAKERGYQTVALSSFLPFIEDAPEAYQHSARCLDQVVEVSDWTNQEEILSRAEEINRSVGWIRGVYFGVDPCAVVAAKLRQRLGLPTPLSTAFELVLDKCRLRRKLVDLNLSSLRNYPGSEVDQWTRWEIEKPAYFKPTHGFSSAYVKRCESLHDLHRARELWKKGDASDFSFLHNYVRSQNEYHLEEAFDGELLSVEGISVKGQFHALGLLSRILYSKDPTVEMGSCFPYPHRFGQEILARVITAHQLLGLTDGPTHTEVMVDRVGNIEVIDLNPRFVGADVLQSINHAFGTKIEDQLLNFALGQTIEVPYEVKNYSCLQYILPPQIERFQSIDFPDKAEVRFQTTFLKPETRIKSHDRQLDYLGCYLTVMPSFEMAVRRSLELRDLVRVNGELEGVY